MESTKILLYLIVFGCLFIPGANVYASTLSIQVAPPEFVLPRFTGPYREREASIAPEEYEMAETLTQLLNSGKTDEVLNTLSRYYDVELSPAMLLLKAQVYLSIDHFEEAEKTFKSVLRRMPHLVRAHTDLGQLYLIQSRLEEAREHFSKAISLGSNDAMILGQLAYLNLQSSGPFSAISAYQQALTLEPNNATWQQGLLSALTQAKMFEAANALVNQLIESKPNDANLWLNLAVLSLEQQNTLDTLKAIEMALLLGDTTETNLKTAVQLHLQLASYDRAAELIGQHFDEYQLNMDILDIYIAWLSQAKKWDEINTILLKQEPKIAQLSTLDQSRLWRHKANTAAAKNESVAIAYFDKSLSLAPNNGLALIDYAKHVATLKQYDLADMLYTRAEAIESQNKEALLGKAQIMFEQHYYGAAINQLSKALKRYPELTYLEQQIAVVRRLDKTLLTTPP